MSINNKTSESSKENIPVLTNESKLYWNKKDGERILIKDMSDNYLLQELKNLETFAKDKHGKTWKQKIDPKYHVLKLHALGRDLIKK